MSKTKKKLTPEQQQAYKDYKDYVDRKANVVTCKVCGLNHLFADFTRQGSYKHVYWCGGCGTLVRFEHNSNSGKYTILKPETLKNIDLKVNGARYEK